MSFCPCGRERIPGERRCRGCGAELRDPVRYEPTVTSAPGPPPQAGYGPPPQAGYGAPPPQAGYDPWAPTGSYAGPPGQPPPSRPMGPGPGQDQWPDELPLFDSYPDVHGADGGHRRPRGPRQRNRVIVVAAVVVALAAAGGAFAVLRNHHGQAQAGSQPTNQASSPAAQSTPVQITPASSPAATPLSSAPSSSPPASPTTGSGGGTGVAVAPGAAGDPAEPQVLTLLNSYFTAINQHDYAAYASLLTSQAQQQDTPSAFASGYATTTDSDETLTGISDTGSGEVAAMVTFTSHQQPANSIDNSACTSWAITLYLVPSGTGYLIGEPPPGYHASYQAC